MGPDDYAASFTTALDLMDALRPRTQQKALGVSSVGLCHAQAQWVMTGVEPTDAPAGRQAFMGSAIHTVIAGARGVYNSKLLIEEHFPVTLPSGYVLPGHADEIDPDEPSVTDYKTVTADVDMVALRRNGANEQQRFQRHLYALGAIQAGLVPEEGLIVRNVWVDRSGQSAEPFVEQEPFSRDVIDRADLWLADVVWSAANGEDPLRDKHYDWCQRFCKFFSHCRINTQPDLIITDTELVEAAKLARLGREMKKEGAALEESGKGKLEILKPDPGGDVVAYVCGDTRVRYSWVNKATGGHFTLHLDAV